MLYSGSHLATRGLESLDLIGVILQLAYRLRRHLWAGWPLSRWLGWLLVMGGLVVTIYGWPRFWLAAPFGMLFLGHVVLLIWASRRRHVHFDALHNPETSLWEGEPPPPALRTEELVPVRASGCFTVEGKSQYYMDVEAEFETVETREHIVLGRVHPSRFLLLGRWPAWEHGWWYIFFQPAMIREMTAGHLHFGRQPRLALRLVYAPAEETREAICLVFQDATGLRRVWDDLLRDAPPQAIHPLPRPILSGETNLSR